MASSTIVSPAYVRKHLAQLLARTEAGEEILVECDGKVIAKLVSVTHETPLRQFGWAKGKIWVAPDAFDPMTDEEVEALFSSPDDLLNS